MTTGAALKRLHEQYNCWLAQAEEAGDPDLCAKYERLRNNVAGLIGIRKTIADAQRDKRERDARVGLNLFRAGDEA